MKRIIIVVMIVAMIMSVVGCTTTEETQTEQVTGETTALSTEENMTVSIEDVVMLTSPIVGTGQENFYDKDGNIIDAPQEGEALYGQDAQYESVDPSFTDNGDGTITDNNTGLIWQKTPDDGTFSWDEALEYCEDLELAGYDNWRLPTAEELFTLIDFEPDDDEPVLDTDYFDFPELSVSAGGGNMDSGPQGGAPEDDGPQGGAPEGDGPQGGAPEDDGPQGGAPGGDGPQGGAPEGDSTESDDASEMPPPPADESAGGVQKEQGQFWSSNYYYVGETHGGAGTAFGVNHVTGHIKGYPAGEAGGQMGKRVRAVVGSIYGEDEYVDNGDGTITDLSTGLMWMQDDLGEAIEWEEALEYCENLEFAGYDDWKLPDVKELQSIVDYSGVYPAVDPDYFNCLMEEDENYYTWLWTSSTADATPSAAWYVAFGKAVGLDGEDSHGAGAVREREKYAESVNTEEGDTYVCSLRAVRVID